MREILNKRITFLLLTGVVSGLFSIYFFGDVKLVNEWPIMLDNLENNKILSVRSVNGVPVPNIFMPPLYPIFLYLIKLLINDINIFLNTVFLIQLTFSVISILLCYKIFLELFSENISLFGTLIFTIFPLNVYAISQISSVTLQVFLINIFLLSFIKIYKGLFKNNILIFSLASALLILLRGEFFIFIIFSIIYLLVKQKNFLNIFFIILIITILISPYIYRNYKIFGVITITKSFGYNLLKGNHPNTVVEGTGMFLNVENVVPGVRLELEELYDKGPIPKHDLLKDEILLKKAVTYIKDDPIKYFKLYLKKFFSFMFIDINSTYPNYYSLFHIIPKLILSVGTLIGIIAIANFSINLSNFFIIYYFANLGLFSFFFILPRYSLSLLTIQILLSLYGIEKIKKKFY